MAELTKEQIESAAQALWQVTLEHRNHCSTTSKWEEVAEHYKEEWRVWARAAAPFLQLPWDTPTTDEIKEITNQIWHWGSGPHRNFDTARFVAGQFVDRRNAALVPKPTFDRRTKILHIVQDLASGRCGNSSVNVEQWTDAIMALDEATP